MKRQRVLVIDDDTWLAELTAGRLEKAGFSSRVAGDALEGMRAVDTWRPACIVLDILMPGPNGVVLLHELQSYTDSAKIPVIVCTNSAEAMADTYIESYGVRRVINKATMSANEVVRAVEDTL